MSEIEKPKMSKKQAVITNDQLSFSWTVLFETNSYKILASKEIEYIDKYKSIEYGYNTQYRNDYNACKRINKTNYRNGFVH